MEMNSNSNLHYKDWNYLLKVFWSLMLN